MAEAFVLSPISTATVHKVSSAPRRDVTVCLAEPNKKGRFQKLATGVASAAIAAAFAFSPGLSADHSIAHAVRGGGGTFRSASGRVNKDAESLLRWGLPIENKAVRDLQSDLEEISYDMKAVKWNNVDSDIRKASTVAKRKTEEILKDVAPEYKEEASKIMDTVPDLLASLADVARLRNSEEVTPLQRDILRNIGKVEQMMVKEFPYEVPEEYKDLPQLKGRATVEMTLQKADNEKFDIDGVLYDSSNMTMVIDGYTAPITSGNFVDLVRKGFYNKMEIMRSDGFVVQTGHPAGEAEGYIDPNTDKMRTIPLEIFPKGDTSPTYGVTLEDDGRATEQTVLPFTAYGTLAMAREEFVADSGSSQFFWFLFEPDLTPAGRNLLDGRYTVFGYVTDGEKFLKDLKAGDMIIEAKVTSGLDNLVAPKDVSEYKGAHLERG
eukprot:Plantae.Rhodophyta-Purpureofilum_apyrenoidigerum.ctg4054.p1 GENE.Plantae.Rhodophyta-Purpureofilum_apyrenoidigerum.ctg4054~~Plantae.Rhodophyta-Purpureofilum_apyrenoidigerum.ctg4054.p1  ORF type:complete len:436 (+),score=103.62 Plantae.Rhodophyta-Purpureofilum_apyrenoidigerum.ctg4054:221-1528(+)